MRIYATLLCVVLLLGIASAGYCQWWYGGVMNACTTARWAGMGGAGIAAANDAAAIDFNPANLANMELDGVDMGRPLAWGGTATYGGGYFDDMSLKIGARNENWGAGFSYERVGHNSWHNNIWGLGFGANAGGGAWSWGVSAMRDQGDLWTATWINAGVVCNIPQMGAPPITVGLLVTNILEYDNDSHLYNLGVAVPVGDKLLLAADAWDITDEFEGFFNFGAELGVAPDWCARIGRRDEDWTVGAGYRKGRLSLDAAYIDARWHDQWLVSGSIPF